MKSLAQLIVDSEPVSVNSHGKNHFEEGIAIFELAKLSLSTPRKEMTDREIKRHAVRFVFTDDAPQVTTDAIVAGHIDAAIPFATARLPSKHTWIEWRVKDAVAQDGTPIPGVTQVGALLLEDDEYRHDLMGRYGKDYAIVCFVFMKYPDLADRPFPAFAIYLPALPPGDPRGLYTAIRWTIDGNKHDQLTFAVIDSIARDILHALFLITTPRVCEVREVAYPPAKQKARLRAGKPPLIEYKQMVLKIGIGHTRYRSGSGSRESDGAHPSGKRFHPVIGHWRTYTEGRETPKVSFVPEHWRGDPAKGIIIHERLVKRS